jgi:hypothetical protein
MARGSKPSLGSPESFPMQLPPEVVSFDPDAFDGFIRSQGVQMVHYRSMRCPVGMTDPDDTMRRAHEHHEDCSNSFVYTKAGEITCSFLSNQKESNFQDYGRLDGSTVQVTFPRFYDDKPETPVQMCQFDRLYLKEEAITVVNWHTFAAHASGVNRLQFPAAEVHDLMDASGRRYAEGIGFTLRKGQIVWADGQGPGVDPKTGKGVVCSVRYSYRPFWYVARMMHEVRVAQVEDEYGDRGVMRFPQQAMLQREHWFEKEQRDAEAPNKNGRQQPGPKEGVFGPR